ncbi:hypothetical protein MSAN_00178900 [Mycena sanguinolenta]|uniref:Uncharacterized protein n=1 Tax=Mycena sanguinolenta TaxID=230812 RepID=A0A8H6ZIJ8_9AGAR|nr:hypothetical protein MSAN_00178900 [Mycena sanguinolenta]
MTTDILEENFVPLESLFSIQDFDALESNIRYRLWFTGFIWYMAAGEGATPVWETILSEASVFWMWEDEDEEYIKEFARAVPVSDYIPFGDWDGVRRALKVVGCSRKEIASNSLAHLTPPESASRRRLAHGGGASPQAQNISKKPGFSRHEYTDSRLGHINGPTAFWGCKNV